MDDIPHDVGYVLGNGPSRDSSETRYDGVTYGCNSIHKEMNVDILVCMDAWYQFEVIASGYPATMNVCSVVGILCQLGLNQKI